MPPPALRIVHGIRQRSLAPQEGLEARAALTATAHLHPVLAPVLPSLLAAVEYETTASTRWDFLMINASALSDVLRTIRTQAKRPLLSFAIWAEIVDSLDKQSGAVLLTRAELAARVGHPANHVSSALAELVAWRFLRRFQNGRQALFTLNANIGTRLPGAAGEAQRERDGPLLRVVYDSGKGRVADARQVDIEELL